MSGGTEQNGHMARPFYIWQIVSKMPDLAELAFKKGQVATLQGRLKTIGGPRLDSNGGPLFFPNFQNTFVLSIYLILGN